MNSSITAIPIPIIRQLLCPARFITHPPFGSTLPVGLQNRTRLLKNPQFCSSSRKAKIITIGIFVIMYCFGFAADALNRDEFRASNLEPSHLQGRATEL
jgi:hypothetical protein